MTDEYVFCCLSCGIFVYPEGYPPIDCLCKPCHNAYWVRKRKDLYAFKRANGWVPESAKKRGKKAYNTRLIRMAHRDPAEYQKRMSKLEMKQPGRARYIKGRARKETISKMGYHDSDLGKVIY